MTGKTSWVLLLCVWVGGCGSYAGVQVRLAEAAREGLARVEAARQQDSAAVRAGLAERQQRLDAAFDADVRARGELSPEWVIDARRAYAVGLGTLLTARQAARDADASARDNARAADEALAVLLRSLRAQERVLNFDGLLPAKEASHE